MSKGKSKFLIALLVIGCLLAVASIGMLVYDFVDTGRETGPQGPQGPAGVVGQRGTLWFKGEGDPNGSGVLSGDVAASVLEGDYFLDTNGSNVYSYNGSRWDFVVSLKGDRGANWDMGSGKPTKTDNVKPGDFYLDASSGNVYQFNDGKWGDKAVFNIKGKDGTKGDKWLYGPNDPVSQGEVGDYYLNTTDSSVWRKLAADGDHLTDYWQQISTIGGEDGAPGKDGAQIYYGTDIPDDHQFGSVTLHEGDLYLRQNESAQTLDLWRYDGNDWQSLGSLNGVQGEPGLPGGGGFPVAVRSW